MNPRVTVKRAQPAKPPVSSVTLELSPADAVTFTAWLREHAIDGKGPTVPFRVYSRLSAALEAEGQW